MDEIVITIKERISEINMDYRTGPSLYFYRKLIDLRSISNNIESFLGDDYKIEILYATLVSWDMNSRGAKMKYFDDFKENILSCLDLFKEIEEFEGSNAPNITGLESILRDVYKNLNLMKTNAKLVSNSKLLHFLFPNLLMPMDRTNTLSYFYGNTGESLNKYIEVTKFSLEIINMPEKWENYLDNKWNSTAPKLIDNAIILIRGISIR